MGAQAAPTAMIEKSVHDPGATSVQEIFARFAERPLLLDPQGRSRTYRECEAIIRRLAGSLRARGLGHGDRVALLLDNSPEFALLYFGCLYAGAVAVPVNPALAAAEISVVLRLARPKLRVCSPRTAPLLPAEDSPTWTIGTSGSNTGADLDFGGPLEAELADDRGPLDSDVFTVHFTSGTTGIPKGVAHRVGGLLGNAAAFNAMISLRSGCKLLHLFPMAYMAGFLNSILCPFVAGGSVLIGGAFDAGTSLTFWRRVADVGVDFIWLAPTMLTALLRLDRGSLGGEYCRQVAPTLCVGTAPLPQAVKDRFEERYGVELLESYGLSELLLITTNTPRSPRVAGSVGRPIPGVTLRIDDPDEGGNGEVLVKTPFAMVGYLDEASGQPRRLPEGGWYPTGDFGRLGATGDLQITGRKKDLIIRGGMNVSPRQVEEVLIAHDAVQHVAVVGLPHEFYGEEVVAFLQLHPGRSLASERAALELLCRGRLNVAAQPTRYIALEELPLSTTGKVQKDQLRMRFSDVKK